MSIPYEYVGTYAYRTDKRLGEGSYGKVFEGKDIRTNAPVAVKKIRSERYNRKLAQDLFQIEIQILKSIKNDHVIKLIDHMETRNHKYLVLELCNMNLRQFLTNTGRVEEKYALRLFIEIVQGLQSLHQNNYCHRDIKPDNILLKDGKIKIIDVNISKQISHTRFSLSVVGTPRYMAPEIKAKQSHSPYQADIFSLGIVFYELLYGLQDFEGERIFTFNQKVHLSESIKNLIKNMLEPNPAIRWGWQQVAQNLFQIHNTINYPLIEENESKLMSTIQTYYIDKWKNSVNILKFIIEHIAILQISAHSINPYPCALLIIKLIISETEKKVLSLKEQGLLQQNQELSTEIKSNSVLIQYRRDFLTQTKVWITKQIGVDEILKEEFIYIEQSARFQVHYRYFLKDFYKKILALNFTEAWQQLKLKTLQFQLLLALDFYNDYEFAQSLLLSQSLINGSSQSILIEKFNSIQEADRFCQALESLLDNEDSDLNINENQN